MALKPKTFSQAIEKNQVSILQCILNQNELFFESIIHRLKTKRSNHHNIKTKNPASFETGLSIFVGQNVLDS